MNDNSRARPPQPGPACEYFAPLLPLVGQERLTPRDSASLRQHLQTCEYCQNELDSYNWLDDTLARHFGPAPRGPLSPSDIRELTSRTYRPHTPPSEARSAPSRGSNHHRQRPAQPLRPQRSRRGRVIAIFSALAAVLIIAAISVALFESHKPPSTSQQQTKTPTPTLPVYVPSSEDTFYDISMVSPSEGWLVGAHSTIQASSPLLLHYFNGRLFQVNNLALHVTSNVPVFLNRIVMFSATEGWAVGVYQPTITCGGSFLLHYSGGQWRQDTTLADTSFRSITFVSPTNGWAAGVKCGDGISTPGIYHYDGAKWTAVAIPAGFHAIAQVVMASASNGWAIGYTSSGGGLLHYDGHTWTDTSSLISNPGELNYSNIAMVSATDGWLAAADFANSPQEGSPAKSILFHYDGTQWRKQTTGLDAIQLGAVNGLSLAPSGNGWLIASDSGSTVYFFQLSGGTWKQVSNPISTSITQVAITGVFTFSADDAWVIGDGQVNNQNQTVFLHYHNGSWETVALTPSPTQAATPTATNTVTVSCTSHTDPTGAANTPGAIVPSVPFANWGTYTNTTYHYQLKYPTNWGLDGLGCTFSSYLAFWNYDYLTWNGPGFPQGGIKIELYALDNPDGLSAMQFFQMEAQNTVGGPPCSNYTTRAPQVDGHDALEATCPGQNTDLYYIADGASMLRFAEAKGANPPAEDVLAQIVGSMTFTN